MKKTLLVAAVAIGVASVAVSGSANAACYWNGYSWNCASPQVYYHPTPISTVTSRIMDIPSPAPTGPTRTGIHRVIPVAGPAATAVIDRPLTLAAPLVLPKRAEGQGIRSSQQRFRDFPC